MPYPPQFPQLLFAANGAVLLYSTANVITAWDVTTQQKRYTCAGCLIGVSQSGATFVTESAHNDYSFWNSTTGDPQPLIPAIISDLPFDVRYRVNLEKTSNGQYHGEWIDIASEQPPSPVKIQTSSASRIDLLDNWIVITPQQWLACAWSWAEDDFDGAYGKYYALKGNLADHVSFTVSRFHQIPPLYFSREHDWFVTGEQNAFNVYTASTGKPYGAGKFYRLDGGGDVVAFHPQERFWLAVNLAPILLKNAVQQGFVLLDINTSANNAKEIQIFPETVPVIALAFHPSGKWIADLLKDGTIHVWETVTGHKAWSFA